MIEALNLFDLEIRVYFCPGISTNLVSVESGALE
jgi:hypothetical protein